MCGHYPKTSLAHALAFATSFSLGRPVICLAISADASSDKPSFFYTAACIDSAKNPWHSKLPAYLIPFKKQLICQSLF
jgi:hypothetical protein